MNRRFLLLLTGLLSLSGTVRAQYLGNPEVPEQLSLQEAIDFALTNSPAALNAALDVRAADADIGEIRAAGLPQINGMAELTDNFQVQTVVLPAEAGAAFGPGPVDPRVDDRLTTLEQQLGVTPPSEPAAPGEGEPLALAFGIRYTGMASVSAQQLLFDGSYFIGLQAARTYKALAQKQFDQSRRDIVENVTKAYYGVLVNDERLKLLDANIERLDSTLRQTRALYENGFAEEIDAMRLEVSLNNLKAEEQNVRQLATVSQLLLKFQLGADLNAPITLTDTLSVDALKATDLSGGEFNYRNRIEYSVLETQRELAELDLKGVRAGYLPTLSLFGRYGFNTGAGDLGGVFTNEWFALGAYGLTLNVPIFDGLRKRYQAQNRRVQQQRVDVGFRQLKQQIDLERTQSRVVLQNSLRNLETQERNYELAQEVSRITNIKFEEGLGANLEVIDAEASLKEAQTNYYQALYDALVAQVDYRRATGQLEVTPSNN